MLPRPFQGAIIEPKPMAAAISVVDMLRGCFGSERIRYIIASKAAVDILPVGSSISDAKPIHFTSDFHEVEWKPVAKRGRLPGITPNPRLRRILYMERG